MIKHEIQHPAGNITHWTSDEQAHKALKKRLETPDKIHLRPTSRMAEKPIGRRSMREKIPDWPKMVDEAWVIFHAMTLENAQFEAKMHRIKVHFEVSLTRAKQLITDARAKYITKGKRL